MDNQLCENCHSAPATERHHLMSNTKMNRKLYGILMERDLNIQRLCYNCHHNKPLKKLTEKEFCKLNNIEPRSKSGHYKQKVKELENEQKKRCLL